MTSMPHDDFIVHYEPHLSGLWSEPGEVEIRTGDGTVVATSTGTMRTEKLETLVAMAPVPHDALAAEDGGQVVQETLERLRKQLARTMAQAGRVPHGDVTVSRHEDPIRDMLCYKAEVKTRESDKGEWPNIHRAYREDQEALRSEEWVED